MNKQNITNFLTTRFLLPSLAFNVAENKRFYSSLKKNEVNKVWKSVEVNNTYF